MMQQHRLSQLGSGHSFLDNYLMHLSALEDGHKVLVLLVGALLHLLVVSYALLDLSAQESHLSQLLGDVVRGAHLLQVGDSGVQHCHCSNQALLSISVVSNLSLRHPKLVVGFSDGPRICRHGLDPLGKADSQILNSLFKVRVLQTDLSQESQSLTFFGHITSLAIDNLCQVKHLPGLLQVTSLNLLSVSLHLIAILIPFHDFILFLLIFLSVIASMGSGHNIMLLKVVLKGIG